MASLEQHLSNMNYQSDYNAKLMTADEAVQCIPARGTLGMGMAASEPPAVLNALEKRLQNGIVEEWRLYYMHSEKPAHNTILKYEYMNMVKLYPFFVGPIERELMKLGLQEKKKVVFYMPSNFSGVPEVMMSMGLDVFVLTVAPMDKAGFFSCGTNVDYTIPTARSAKKVIIEVNRNMPRVFGDSCLHISEIDAIVENTVPLCEIASRPSTELDHQIGQFIAPMVPDRATVQFGVGGVPNAVCEMLHDRKDLGVHSELMGPGLA